jgi:predicted amidohydrolase
VLPEAGLQGYGYDDAESVRRDASALDEPPFTRVRDQVAEAGLHAIVGFVERDGDRIFNSAALVDPEGSVLALHRKIHLPCLGLDRFVDRGDREPPVAETPAGRVGMLICADMIFPEAARVAALQGADVIAISACVPQSVSIYADHLIRVRAYENCAFVVFADMAGADGDWHYEGRSQIADAEGRVVAEAPADGAHVIAAALDLDDARTKVRVREPRGGIPHSYEVDFFGQRRPELYARIADPRGRQEAAEPALSSTTIRKQGELL